MNKYCIDCYFCIKYETGELDCGNGNAIVENGAPLCINSDPHDCPFFKEH